MRLLHTTQLRFQEFFDDQVPKYAILSHRWGSDEVSFQEFLERTKVSGDGYEKVMKCCQLAASNNYAWMWIDACCIDKKSSAELSEAINSMYSWYRDAEICYAYLSDVYPDENSSPPGFSNDRDKRAYLEQHGSEWMKERAELALFEGEEEEMFYKWEESFYVSSWFKRGWTLQELLAPKQVQFFDYAWIPIGTRKSLIDYISVTTSIDENAIRYPKTIHHYSVAQKMAWAAGRSTSRVEDIAYCLLGIFNINMPLLYGEGIKAFVRLQEEIIRTSDDESIFTWGSRYDSPLPGSLLASSPESFSTCWNTRRKEFYRSKSYSFTNRGLNATAPILRHDKHPWIFIPLNCTDDGINPLALMLSKEFSDDESGGRLVRHACVNLKDNVPEEKWSTSLRQREKVEVEIKKEMAG